MLPPEDELRRAEENYARMMIDRFLVRRGYLSVEVKGAPRDGGEVDVYKLLTEFMEFLEK
jgi:hypothetical protein